MTKISTVEPEWHRADSEYSILLYTLKQHGWRRGEPMMVNDLMVRIANANGSQNDLAPIAETILSALASRRQEPVNEPAYVDTETALIERIGEICFKRHAKGFICWPLMDVDRIKVELRQALRAAQADYEQRIMNALEPTSVQKMHESLPAPVVTDEMVEKFRAELEELVDVHMTGQLVKRCLTAALQKQEGGTSQ